MPQNWRHSKDHQATSKILTLAVLHLIRRAAQI
jgi:hypothetical protein